MSIDELTMLYRPIEGDHTNWLINYMRFGCFIFFYFIIFCCVNSEVEYCYQNVTRKFVSANVIYQKNLNFPPTK